MANTKQAKKEVRKSGKRRVQNSQQRARLRTLDKQIRELARDGKTEEARAAFRAYEALLDRAGKTHLIHPRQADRRKSRMAHVISKKPAAGSA